MDPGGQAGAFLASSVSAARWKQVLSPSVRRPDFTGMASIYILTYPVLLQTEMSTLGSGKVDERSRGGRASCSLKHSDRGPYKGEGPGSVTHLPGHPNCSFKRPRKPGSLLHTYSPCTWEAETEDSP